MEQMRTYEHQLTNRFRFFLSECHLLSATVLIISHNSPASFVFLKGNSDLEEIGWG